MLRPQQVELSSMLLACSESGVLNTRSRPNFSSSPTVQRNTPPKLTSSPKASALHGAIPAGQPQSGLSGCAPAREASRGGADSGAQAAAGGLPQQDER
jgi:hypothetical protein